MVVAIVLLGMYYQLMMKNYSKKSYNFDQIEGYNYDGSSNNLYDRTVRDVELIPSSTANVIDSSNNNKQAKESVKAYVYHRTNQCDRKKLIPSGDWLQRGRDDNM